MAQAATAGMQRLSGTLTAGVRRAGRDTRLMVPLCIVLICGSFVAAAIAQMRLDHAHALAQAAAFERVHVRDVANATARTLDRYIRTGRVFAASPQQYHSADLGRVEPAIRDILVWENGAPQSRFNATDTLALAAPRFAGQRALLTRNSDIDGLVVRDGSRVIAVLFDPASLMQPRIALAAQAVPGAISAPVPGWPLAAVTRVDEAEALRAWTGAVPLYLFAILGPALAGGWLASLFVGAFERHARAARAIRALKSTRPIEARLMVRLANAERGAVEALRAKSEFIAHMSHELRTPLNAVIGFSEVIARGFYGPAGHPKYSEYAHDIGNAGRELHAKIGDILEFANIEAGRYPLTWAPVDLAAVAGACIDEHQGRAFSRRITLAIGLGEPGMVRADALAVRRILSNLLANALTYTAEGGLVRADVRFEEGAGVLILTDSGQGFSPAERGKAGKPFTRFDRPGTVTGAGLGLAIAIELARRMGGAMRLAGESGHGATMELRLPRL